MVTNNCHYNKIVSVKTCLAILKQPIKIREQFYCVWVLNFAQKLKYSNEIDGFSLGDELNGKGYRVLLHH